MTAVLRNMKCKIIIYLLYSLLLHVLVTSFSRTACPSSPGCDEDCCLYIVLLVTVCRSSPDYVENCAMHLYIVNLVTACPSSPGCV